MSIISDSRQENDPRQDVDTKGRLPAPALTAQQAVDNQVPQEPQDGQISVPVAASEPLPSQVVIPPDETNTLESTSDPLPDSDQGETEINPVRDSIDPRGDVWDKVNTPDQQAISDVERAEKGIYAPIEQEFLDSSTAPAYYEIDLDNTREGLELRTQEFQEFDVRKIKEETLEFLYDITKPEIVNNLMSDDSASTNIELNSLDNPLRNGSVPGMIRSIYPGRLEGLEEGTEFAPFRGYRMYWDSIKKNPWNLLKLPAAFVIAGGQNRYGEMGDGLLGGLFYTASLPSNIVLGGATDIYNIVTGTTNPTSKTPNVIQGILGKDYDFTALAGTDRPLSFVGTKEAPQTIADWKRRSILTEGIANISGLSLVERVASFLGDPDLLEQARLPQIPGGGRTLQAGEFLAALGTGVIILDPFEIPSLIGKAGKLKNVKFAKEVASAAAAAQVRASTAAANIKIYREATDTIDNVTPLVKQLSEPKNVLALEPESLKYTRRTRQELTDIAKSVQLISPTADEISAMRLQKLRHFNPELFSTHGRATKILPVPTGVSDAYQRLRQGDRLNIEDILDDVSETIPDADIHNFVPKGLLPSADNYPEVRKLITLQNEHTRISNEAQEVAAELVEQQHVLKESMEKIDEIPDIGRHDILDPVPQRFEATLDDLLESIDVPAKEVGVSNIATVRQVGVEGGVPTYEVVGGFTPKPVNGMVRVIDLSVTDVYGPSVKLVDVENIVRTGKEEVFNIPIVKQVGTVSGEAQYELVSGSLPKAVNGMVRVFDSTNPDAYSYVNKLVDVQNIVSVPDIPISEVAVELNNFVWSHGTKVKEIDLSFLDPFQGAARGELGTGIYLTNNPETAVKFAKATPARNVPPVPTRTYSDEGFVHNIKTTFNRVLQADEPVSAFKDTLIESIETAGLDEQVVNTLRRKLLRKELNIEQVFDEINQAVGDVYDEFPEEAVLSLQRDITSKIRLIGYDAIVKITPEETVVSVLNPTKIVTEAVTSVGVDKDTLSQTAYRFNVDKRTSEIFSTNKTTSVNLEESARNLQTELVQQTSRIYTELEQDAIRYANEIVDQEDTLKNLADDYRNKRTIMNDNRWADQNDNIIKHNKKIDDGWC